MTVRDAANIILDMNFWLFLFVVVPIWAFLTGFCNALVNDLFGEKNA